MNIIYEYVFLWRDSEQKNIEQRGATQTNKAELKELIRDTNQWCELLAAENKLENRFAMFSIKVKYKGKSKAKASSGIFQLWIDINSMDRLYFNGWNKRRFEYQNSDDFWKDWYQDEECIKAYS